MKWWFFGFGLCSLMVYAKQTNNSSPSSTIMYSVNGGSYNSFLKQVGYCKLQSFETTSRNTSSAPSIFQSGNILFGVGLSHVQFQHTIVSCGKCIQVLTIDRFYEFNEELTGWNYQKSNHGNFTVMVFDECTDPICKSGFLDFDIYHEKQPVAYGNPIHLSWQFVPCPVSSNDKIEFLFCLGYESCHEQHPEGRTVGELYHQAIEQNWFTIYPRNFRVAIHSIHVQGEALQDIQSWVWTSLRQELLEDLVWILEWTNDDDTRQSWLLDWTQYLDQTSTFGYRGGFVIPTTLQN